MELRYIFDKVLDSRSAARTSRARTVIGRTRARDGQRGHCLRAPSEPPLLASSGGRYRGSVITVSSVHWSLEREPQLG